MAKRLPTKLGSVASMQALVKHYDLHNPKFEGDDVLPLVTSEGTLEVEVQNYCPINAHNNLTKGTYGHPFWYVRIRDKNEMRLVHAIQLLKPTITVQK